MNISQKIAQDLSIQLSQVERAIALLDEGATVPFIARYRKEVTGSLDDQQLRKLDEQLQYLRELNERRLAIIHSIQEQGKLTPELAALIEATDSKTVLEDLYLPYKPKRRTKAQIAKEAGLLPLAMALLEQPEGDPQTQAQAYVNVEKLVPDVEVALEGARQILMEYFSEDAQLLGQLREYTWQHVRITSKACETSNADTPTDPTEAAKFRDYFDFSEAAINIPSHRALAIFRGRRENYLQVKLVLPDEPTSTSTSSSTTLTYPEHVIAKYFKIGSGKSALQTWLLETIRRAWKYKIFVHLDSEIQTSVRERAEEEAIKVFANNLRDLLLAAPAGPRVTMGLDPGIRTGVKVVIVDRTGKLLETQTIYPLQPRNEWDESISILTKLCLKHQVELISIGNGTGSRETDKLVAEVLKNKQITAQKIVVSEAGASVYSASELAAKEFPALDVTLRGAVSIARRLQDPLAELVKIDPKSIGVGQYQHDVNQITLARCLGNVVEDCVNAVGVDVNTASAPLLARVSGLSESLAQQVVVYRDQHGAYQNREQLKLVKRMGDKTYEQAAGFLRIMNGTNPLDASAVHPEAYPIVEKILKAKNKSIKEVIANKPFLKSLNPKDYCDQEHGIPTVVDIIAELEKPGRDPRPQFKTATFQEGVEQISDVKPGMILEGVVSNVTNFGAFVDIGVHQDGLVHISQLANTYVKDPREIVKSGDIVKVKVLEVDAARKRISLSMKLQAAS